MNSRGRLRSTLRSFRQDEITQVVPQVMATYGKWTSGVVRDVRRRSIGEDGEVSKDAIVEIERDHVEKLCAMVCQCVLTLRFGTEDAHSSDDDQ